MTAITLTEGSVEDMPMNLVSGTGRRRVKFYIRTTTGGTGDTFDLATIVPNSAGIEGLGTQSVAAAEAATSATWSTNTITFAGHTSSGVTYIEGTAYLN